MSSRSRGNLGVLLTTVIVVAIAGTSFAQQEILNDPERPDAERARDPGSKPLELYSFLGVEPGMMVADLMPGRGYNTYILSKLVGADGTVYSGPDRRGRLAERLQNTPLSNVTAIDSFDGMPADSVDVILTVRNVHDLENRGNSGPVYEQWLAALKPGGVLGVVDARTPKPGFDDSTHRINQQTVIDSITSAGFELVGTSELLAKPNDNFDESSETGNRYEVDRMTLKFQKPQ